MSTYRQSPGNVGNVFIWRSSLVKLAKTCEKANLIFESLVYSLPVLIFILSSHTKAITWVKHLQTKVLGVNISVNLALNRDELSFCSD